MTAASSPAPHKPGLLLPTLLTVIGTVVLCTLGTWQLQRMGEKHAYIDRLQEQAAGKPAPMPPSASWAKLDPAALDLTHVVAKGSYIDDRIAGVRTTIAAGPGAESAAASAGKSALLSTRVTFTPKDAHQATKSGFARLVPDTRPGCARSWWMRMEA